ncbi:hypothetical protein ONS95_014465 [Cadophora gregata]|uniref:uncharacterized protein n=1 Tax=Cadophora gregata TaxID=51156 RepID=UPI0026DC1F39|nr:uncharacterized protein ONS95_014465 [Cadophora gregata]KAK0112729.1 hypothetical protein ONS95_014465 [Cadophora gregata]KAK0124863.1 hypothetical protein ONS96_008742 [Cadophora gregata f. sp. sojae]
MTRRKRHAVEEPDHFNDPHESTRKYIKAEAGDETPHAPDPSYPAVILSGFTWNMDVDARISRALEIYKPLFLEVSLELPAHEKLAIKNQYGIQTDFVKVVCGSAEDQEKMANDLNHARYTWTNPHLEVRKVDGIGRINGVKANSQQPRESCNLNTASILNPEQERREAQAKVWIKLAEAITNARTHLFGDDLDTFEALIAKPIPGVDPMDRVNSWIRGGAPISQPQKLKTGIQRIKVDNARDAGEDKENVTMDDEMADMGVTFGRTDMIPWW